MFYTDEEVKQLSKKTENKKPGFFDNVKNIISKRADNVNESLERQEAGKQGTASSALQLVGQSAGALGDIAFEGVKQLLPDKAKGKIKNIGLNILDTPAGKDLLSAAKIGSDYYNQIKQRYPAEAANFEAVVNIGSIFPAQKATQIVANTGKEILKDGTKIAVKGTAQTLESTSKVTKAIGKEIFESAIPFSEQEAGFIQAYRAKNTFMDRVKSAIDEKPLEGKPKTSGETAFDYGMQGTEAQIGYQAKDAADNLWKKALSPALKSVKEKINIHDVFNETEKRINKIKDVATKKDRLDALNSFRDDYKHVGSITYERLQGIKENWAEYVPEKVYRGKPITGAYNNIRNELSDVAREKIYKALDANDYLPYDVDPRQIYFDYGNLKNLQTLGKKALTESKLKGGFGGFVSGAAEIMLTPVKTVGGRVLYKSGNGLEFIARKGLKKLSDLLE